VELRVNFIDTGDSNGPAVRERLIGEALSPFPKGLVVATKGAHRGEDRSLLDEKCSPLITNSRNVRLREQERVRNIMKSFKVNLFSSMVAAVLLALFLAPAVAQGQG
jgi:aryl-alcohol dehydrogenase-like predicted oxidoreductase